MKSGIEELLARPWFQCAWILQEVASAHAATIVCGRKSVPAYVLALMPSLLELELNDHMRAVLDILPGRMRMESWWSERRDLHFLLWKFAGGQATYERDKVFALLGISSDACQSDVFPSDCTKSLEEVY